MALMRFLTMGRSLSRAWERPHRYKLMNGSLPTFGNSVAPNNITFEVPVTHGVGSGVKQERAAGEVMRTENVAVAEQTRKASLTHAFQLKRWTLKVNPFKSTKTALKPVIQGELSLDRVKPLRNDLSDADLELVAAAKQPEPAPVKIESEEVPVLQAQPFWPRVRSLFARRA